MQPKHYLLFFGVMLCTLNAKSQLLATEDRLLSGPMQGHTTEHSISVWIMVDKADSVCLSLRHPISGKLIKQTKAANEPVPYKDACPLIFEFNDLDANTDYHLNLQIDKRTLRKTYYVSTLHANNTCDFSFMLGSCALWVPRGLRWLHPGLEEWIYPQMTKAEGEFMLWLGDYLYYMPGDYSSVEKMYRRYVKTRRYHYMHMDFVRSRPQYAIWDDHEYGPNDSDRDYVYKDTTLAIHRRFWPNPGFGQKEYPGVYFKFSYQDAEFFMMDCRYNRSKPNIKGGEMLGKHQLEWLKNGLKNSKATFKFVAIGSQVLNEMSANESYANFPEEKKDFMDFLEKEKITGVIFLSGDRHHTELIKKPRQNAYPLYDFTCSPITSFRRPTSRTAEKDNPLRVTGTLADYQNFGRIAIEGEPGKRSCTLYTYNNLGKLVWEYTINENELKYFKN